MRVKFCFLHFWLSKSLSKWKAHAGRVTQIMPPQTSPALHTCTEESCCYSCMLEMPLVTHACDTVGQWVTYLKFFPPNDAGPWAGVQPHTAVQGHPVSLTLHRSNSTGPPWGQSSPSPSSGPAPPQPGQGCRKAANP